MTIPMWVVARHVDRQKRQLHQYVCDNGACDTKHALDLSGVDVEPSILRSMLSRNVVRQTASGRYFLDPSRVNDAFGASHRFVLYALGATLLGIFLIVVL